MSVIRIHKTKDFTIMGNLHFREKEMSLKAKGLLSLMLSLPDDWNYSIRGLCAIVSENETAVKTALKELQKFGYLKIKKINPSKSKSGRYEYEYDIYENKVIEQECEKQGIEKQGVENQPLEILPIENQLQVNTNVPNTKKPNIDKPIIKEKGIFSIPKIEEISQYCLERENSIDAEAFFDYYQTRKWESKGTKIKDWKAAVRTWEHNQKRFDKNKPYDKNSIHKDYTNFENWGEKE